MKRKIKIINKRGSYAILACILFSSIMILAQAAIHAAGENAIASTAESFGILWGRSILAEYDTNLKDRYGIFAFSGNEVQVEEKLENYVKYSCDEKKYITLGGCECSLSGYELCEAENFFAQIKEAVLCDAKPVLSNALAERGNEVSNTSLNSSSNASNRFIRNQRIINSLPSGGSGKGIEINSLAQKIKESQNAEDLIEDSAENIYIFRFFKHCLNDGGLGETYFSNEIEYILTGRLDDLAAKKKVKSNLTILRNVLNLAYLYSCEEKRQQTLAVAEILMPEAPLLLQALIMEGWAFMEARNDVKLLYADKKVPLIKKDENWAISLRSMLAAEYGCDTDGNEVNVSNDEGKGYILPPRVEGKSYEDYLRILVTVLPKETKKLRILDLIQINMKYLYCEYFLISDYHTGLKYSILINGKKHEFDEKY